MTRESPLRRYTILAVAAVGLAACTPFASLRHKPVPAPPPPPPPKPELPLAQATHTFIVPPHDDVVGLVQVTVASKEDTLPDIARAIRN